MSNGCKKRKKEILNVNRIEKIIVNKWFCLGFQLRPSVRLSQSYIRPEPEFTGCGRSLKLVDRNTKKVKQKSVLFKTEKKTQNILKIISCKRTREYTIRATSQAWPNDLISDEGIISFDACNFALQETK